MREADHCLHMSSYAFANRLSVNMEREKKKRRGVEGPGKKERRRGSWFRDRAVHP